MPCNRPTQRGSVPRSPINPPLLFNRAENEKKKTHRISESGSPFGERGTGADLAAFLAANPGLTPRDYKGKGFTEFSPFDKYRVEPNEEPWHTLDRDEVRRLATGTKARFLPRNVRQAAARDTGLEWDERALAYRLRSGVAPCPPTAKETGLPREGMSKVYGLSPSRPAAATEEIANMEIGSSRGRARGHQGGSS